MKGRKKQTNTGGKGGRPNNKNKQNMPSTAMTSQIGICGGKLKITYVIDFDWELLFSVCNMLLHLWTLRGGWGVFCERCCVVQEFGGVERSHCIAFICTTNPWPFPLQHCLTYTVQPVYHDTVLQWEDSIIVSTSQARTVLKGWTVRWWWGREKHNVPKQTNVYIGLSLFN